MNNSLKSGFDPTRLMDLTEAEDIKKRQEYTEELHKKSSLKKEFIGPGLHLRPAMLIMLGHLSKDSEPCV